MNNQSILRRLLVGGYDGQAVNVNLGLLFLRLLAGLSLAFGHGIRKLPVSDGFIQGVAELGFPLPVLFAWAAGLSEFVGGLLVAAGLLTRPAAFFVFFTMMVAAFGRHAADPFSTKEKALVFGGIALAIMLIGAGRFAVDALLRTSKPSEVS